MNRTKKNHTENTIVFRCKTHNCEQRLMDYHITGKNVNLNLEAFKLKCTKCKRVMRLKNYTEIC